MESNLQEKLLEPQAPDNRQDLYLVFLIEFFIEIPFALVISGSTIYNIDIQKFTEIEAGIIFALIGLIVGISAVVFSSFPVNYGIKLSLFYASTLGLITHLLLLLWENRYFQVLVMFIFFIPSISMNFISLKLAVKNLSTLESRSFRFSVFYTIFFAACGVSAAAVDVLLSTFGVTRRPFEYIFLANSICYLVSIVLVLKLRSCNIDSQDLAEELRSTSVLTKHHIYKFFSLIILLSIVKSMFFHLTATLPTYMYRQIGEGAHFGYVLAGHQLVLILSTPLLTFLTSYFSSYSLLLIGSFITSFSVISFLFGSNYWTITIFAMIISIGEAIYSPRLVDYTLQVAPQGKEALYIGLANIPNFLSLLITGISSGVLLTLFCNKETSKCEQVWLWIGGYSSITCIILLILRSIYNH